MLVKEAWFAWLFPHLIGNKSSFLQWQKPLHSSEPARSGGSNPVSAHVYFTNKMLDTEQNDLNFCNVNTAMAQNHHILKPASLA